MSRWTSATAIAADGLVQGDEAAVFMDKAYDSAARREALAEAGIADGICIAAMCAARSPPGSAG
jgi:IS5 family transposase